MKTLLAIFIILSSLNAMAEDFVYMGYYEGTDNNGNPCDLEIEYESHWFTAADYNIKSNSFDLFETIPYADLVGDGWRAESEFDWRNHGLKRVIKFHYKGPHSMFVRAKSFTVEHDYGTVTCGNLKYISEDPLFKSGN